ncbi:hypothetical protein TTHERM_000885885 (macronuclear) [Tetrahymena thermophila SB210]|uniref:Uncharacterized protein n=1 Tax=Tetrahymena thermophila (strain SB210) TaxID=312017 RepID=W7XKK3_TETTS|nr:hypothetical protein TTHERM_000885885 [Tetrahymena thermophila SB210]EWS76611.1 hypothetical protein TTHERM_000885885 [Tetrahymena thermophila SB210]|eukprot:XP_012650897.1 hypothetical protein TTHERM_000885885 [Tetrahymena thermophila SB210]
MVKCQFKDITINKPKDCNIQNLKILQTIKQMEQMMHKYKHNLKYLTKIEVELFLMKSSLPYLLKLGTLNLIKSANSYSRRVLIHKEAIKANSSNCSDFQRKIRNESNCKSTKYQYRLICERYQKSLRFKF